MKFYTSSLINITTPIFIHSKKSTFYENMCISATTPSNGSEHVTGKLCSIFMLICIDRRLCIAAPDGTVITLRNGDSFEVTYTHPNKKENIKVKYAS